MQYIAYASIFRDGNYHYVGQFKSFSLTDIKRRASRLCNHWFSVSDQLCVIGYDPDTEERITAELYRKNKKMPNNTIIRGQWR